MKILLVLALATAALHAQQTPEVPDWAQPGSPTHKQVPPPADFHRPSRTSNTPIGIFEGQSDIGSAVVPGSSSYDPATKQYTIHSAGYNIWYSRDEFRFLWKKMSGDVSLAADVSFLDPKGYNDRKCVLVIRQNLDDDSPEAMAGQHGTGMTHLAARLTKEPTSATTSTASPPLAFPPAPTPLRGSTSNPNASESKSTATRFLSTSQSRGSLFTSSVLPFTFTSTGPSTSASVSPRTYQQLPTPAYSPT